MHPFLLTTAVELPCLTVAWNMRRNMYILTIQQSSRLADCLRSGHFTLVPTSGAHVRRRRVLCDPAVAD